MKFLSDQGRGLSSSHGQLLRQVYAFDEEIADDLLLGVCWFSRVAVIDGVPDLFSAYLPRQHLTTCGNVRDILHENFLKGGQPGNKCIWAMLWLHPEIFVVSFATWDKIYGLDVLGFPDSSRRRTEGSVLSANFNSKALHALFNAVSTNQLKVIANCDIANEVWEKLKVKNEGTDVFKKFILLSLDKAFENLTMEEDESIAEFHEKLCGISNESYAPGETYSNAKLVCKVLRVLPRRFKAKVTSIEEVHEIEDLDLDELIGSLQNYELTFKRWSKSKKQPKKENPKPNTNIAFVHKEEQAKVADLSNNLADDTYVLLTKNYAKFLKKNFNKKHYGGNANSFKKFTSITNKQPQSLDKKTWGIQCRECDGYGHIQSECANTLKKKNALAVTWSDTNEDKDDRNSDCSDQEKKMVAFLAKSTRSDTFEEDADFVNSDSYSVDRKVAYEIALGYKLLYKKGKNLTIEESLSSAPILPFVSAAITKNNDGSGSSAEVISNSKEVTIPPNVSSIRETPTCDHIRPRCYKLQFYLQVMIERGGDLLQPSTNSTKSTHDSGCSNHMAGNKIHFLNFKESQEGLVTFGDGNKGVILGKCDLVLAGLPPLTVVLYVKGLKANLLSVSQLCDASFTVSLLFVFVVVHLLLLYSYSKLKVLISRLDVLGFPNSSRRRTEGAVLSVF
ncbi:uncharacterized protein LOC133795656 [Humulus lupulus]|uniref:uncharacterized protein LOC133795656 n=1 Tax=Humulus lupulus TaxID=3486 RepID=UPI002B4156F4|nr:uncharacterized protein LOC133795656 [Humulus lupulus]